MLSSNDALADYFLCLKKKVISATFPLRVLRLFNDLLRFSYFSDPPNATIDRLCSWTEQYLMNLYNIRFTSCV